MPRSLLEEFCAEASDLLDEIGSTLLTLEERPQDTGVVNQLFRQFHTIKGSSGLFDLAAITSLAHAAEDVLAAVRAGELEVRAELVDDLLACADLLRSWVREVEETGALEVASSELAALQRQIRRWTGRPGASAGLVEASVDEARAWLALLPSHEVEVSRAWLQRTGVRLRVFCYTPARDAFFSQEDPVALLRSVPALDLIGASLRGTTVESFDCGLHLVGTTRAQPAEIALAFAGGSGSVAYAELGGAEMIPGARSDPAGVSRRILEAQVATLEHTVPGEQFEGRVRAAARSAAASLRAVSGRSMDDELGAVLEAAVARQDVSELTALLKAALDAGSSTRPTPHLMAGGTAGSQLAGFTPVERDRHLRVDRTTVDRLLRYAGELAVQANALPFLAARAFDEGAVQVAKQIEVQSAVNRRLADDLQDLVLDMRMLPLSSLFGRFPRMVRDYGRQANKQISLQMSGGEIVADADVIDLLTEALIHLVRNALDHGIEGPEERSAASKPPTATLTLRGTDEPDGLLVEVADDGRGMDLDALRQRAVEAAAMSTGEVEGLDRAAAVELAFLPGLSTKTDVSELSGRGVGLDAVRTALAGARGTVELTTESGVGTTVRLRMPRSISITDALVVEAAGQSFAFPIDHVLQTVRVPAEAVHRLGHAAAVDLRGEIVPVHGLTALLGLDDGKVVAAGESLLVVARTLSGPVALCIDRIEAREEVLVKPLEGVLAGRGAFAGTALRADGSVVLVVDTEQVADAR